MYFLDRRDAGYKLAHSLRHYKDTDAVVYALPRGGVPVGIVVAKKLHVPFDLAIATKISNPGSLERIIGAVTSDGAVLYNEEESKELDAVWLNWAVLFAEREVRRQNMLFRGRRRRYPARGKTAIIVDDGIATGLTMRAVVRSIAKERPQKIVVAVPVASHEALESLKAIVDEVVVLDDADLRTGTVSTHYGDYSHLTDWDVVQLVEKYDSSEGRN